jgi:hypothetical protein
LEEFVSHLNDQRIRYYHCSDRMNMHQNFDLAIEKARGSYVCSIGDDDGLIVPAALSSLRRAISFGADAVLTETYSYSWPGTVHPLWGDMGGPVRSSRVYPGVGETLFDPTVALEELFRRGAVGGLGMLPRVYHGYVSRASLAALKQRCGTYFPGGSPDLANAVALVAFVDSVFFDPSVTIISGHSPRSGGGQGASGRHHGELDQVSHLPPETIRDWEAAIPRFWSGTTIYAQTAIEAARAVGLTPTQPFNYTKVCTACLVYEPAKYREHVRAALRVTRRRWSDLWLSIAVEYAAMTIRRVRVFIRNFAFFRLGLGVFGRFDSVGGMMIRLASGSDGRKSV